MVRIKFNNQFINYLTKQCGMSETDAVMYILNIKDGLDAYIRENYNRSHTSILEITELGTIEKLSKQLRQDAKLKEQKERYETYLCMIERYMEHACRAIIRQGQKEEEPEEMYEIIEEEIEDDEDINQLNELCKQRMANADNPSKVAEIDKKLKALREKIEIEEMLENQNNISATKARNDN